MAPRELTGSADAGQQRLQVVAWDLARVEVVPAVVARTERATGAEAVAGGVADAVGTAVMEVVAMLEKAVVMPAVGGEAEVVMAREGLEAEMVEVVGAVAIQAGQQVERLVVAVKAEAAGTVGVVSKAVKREATVRQEETGAVKEEEKGQW